MKKIAILSDIHANKYVLDLVLDQLKKESIDEYIVCGDMITDGYQSNEVLNQVKALTDHVVFGNREEKIFSYDGFSWDEFSRNASYLYTFNSLSRENYLYLKTLPIYKVIEIEGKKICISHGSPFYIKDKVDKERTALFDELLKHISANIYLFGHTHDAFYSFYKGSLFINPGAISLAAGKKCVATYGILTIDDGKVLYEERSCPFSFSSLKNYYFQDKYHDACIEWCNIILYTMKLGVNHCEKFISFLESHSLSWHDAFLEYMKKEDLEIL